MRVLILTCVLLISLAQLCDPVTSCGGGGGKGGKGGWGGKGGGKGGGWGGKGGGWGGKGGKGEKGGKTKASMMVASSLLSKLDHGHGQPTVSSSGYPSQYPSTSQRIFDGLRKAYHGIKTPPSQYPSVAHYPPQVNYGYAPHQPQYYPHAPQPSYPSAYQPPSNYYPNTPHELRQYGEPQSVSMYPPAYHRK